MNMLGIVRRYEKTRHRGENIPNLREYNKLQTARNLATATKATKIRQKTSGKTPEIARSRPGIGHMP